MYVARSVKRGNPRLASALNENARDMTTRALNRLGPAERTVAGEIVALRLVERFARAVEFADWTMLLSWVDTACRRYAGLLPAGDLLVAAAVEVAATIEATASSGLDRVEVDVVLSEIARLGSLPRLVREPALHEAIDEIDVQLDDLMSRLDSCDALTAEHSRAVSAWCARIAKRLALSKHDALHVTRCGLIHDIGKIETPLAILNAPRSLSDDEMNVMRRHAPDGAKIIAATPLVTYLTPGVRGHHERFDGRGYPDGLAAAAIPSFARIVSVADAFNAMIGRRPYRPPFSPSVALERLVDQRGTQFDPIVVDAMIDVVSNRT